MPGWLTPWGGAWGGAWGGTVGAVVPPVVDWGLIAWQPRFFTERCDLWEPDFPIPAGGDPAATTYTARALNVPAHFIRKSSVDQAMLIGLVESDDLMTVDEIHLPTAASYVDSSWILVDRSRDLGGNPVASYGKAYIARGEPSKHAATLLPRRTEGKVIAFVSKLPLLPPGVS